MTEKKRKQKSQKRRVKAVRVLMPPEIYSDFDAERNARKLSFSNLGLMKMGYPLNKVGRRPKDESA